MPSKPAATHGEYLGRLDAFIEDLSDGMLAGLRAEITEEIRRRRVRAKRVREQSTSVTSTRR